MPAPSVPSFIVISKVCAPVRFSDAASMRSFAPAGEPDKSKRSVGVASVSAPVVSVPSGSTMPPLATVTVPPSVPLPPSVVPFATLTALVPKLPFTTSAPSFTAVAPV